MPFDDNNGIIFEHGYVKRIPPKKTPVYIIILLLLLLLLYYHIFIYNLQNGHIICWFFNQPTGCRDGKEKCKGVHIYDEDVSKCPRPPVAKHRLIHTAIKNRIGYLDDSGINVGRVVYPRSDRPPHMPGVPMSMPMPMPMTGAPMPMYGHYNFHHFDDHQRDHRYKKKWNPYDQFTHQQQYTRRNNQKYIKSRGRSLDDDKKKNNTHDVDVKEDGEIYNRSRSGSYSRSRSGTPSRSPSRSRSGSHSISESRSESPVVATTTTSKRKRSTSRSTTPNKRQKSNSNVEEENGDNSFEHSCDKSADDEYSSDIY